MPSLFDWAKALQQFANEETRLKDLEITLPSIRFCNTCFVDPPLEKEVLLTLAGFSREIHFYRVAGESVVRAELGNAGSIASEACET